MIRPDPLRIRDDRNDAIRSAATQLSAFVPVPAASLESSVRAILRTVCRGVSPHDVADAISNLRPSASDDTFLFGSDAFAFLDDPDMLAVVKESTESPE